VASIDNDASGTGDIPSELQPNGLTSSTKPADKRT
jgi:hypothetical protein